ncbi:MFS transporter [Arthrobacter sp. JCM 19049]|uniref:MFS transporter n=1 Tax=Arthrobacter sp. JCM 19049 TaxID=1460643 RepID=UPI0006CFBBE5|nr:MFS transporter [Arthrobacter sp. JCM 19049]
MTFPMMAGLLVISTGAGWLISRYGKWKALVVSGSILQVIGLFLLGSIHYDTPFVLVATYMFILGAGVGLVMQNMVLVVQNSVAQRELGVASSAVNFFRTLGGTAGTAGLGALLAISIPNMLEDRKNELMQALASLGDKAAEVGAALNSGSLPEISSLPEPVRVILESTYGDAVAQLFAVAAPISIITVIAVLLLPNQSLSTQTRTERMRDEQGLVEVDPEHGLAAAAVTTEPHSPPRMPRRCTAGSGAGQRTGLGIHRTATPGELGGKVIHDEHGSSGRGRTGPGRPGAGGHRG